MYIKTNIDRKIKENNCFLEYFLSCYYDSNLPL